MYEKIKDVTINTKGLDLGDIEYKNMMHDYRIVCSQDVAEIYDRLNRRYRYMINMKDEYIDNLTYVSNEIRKEFRETGYSDSTICDMLVHYLYSNKKRRKQVLWFCYGDKIVENLCRNLDLKKTKIIQCQECDEWVEVSFGTRVKLCENCRKKVKIRKKQSI